MKPLRLCMLVHEYFPRDFRVRREARALASAGWQVEIVCLRRPQEKEGEIIDGLQVLRLNVQRHRGAPLAVYLAEYAAFAAQAAAYLCVRPKRYSVVHVHAPPDFLVFSALPARLAGAAVILDIHDLTPELYLSRFKGRGGRLAQIFTRSAEYAACAFADQVITVTNAFRSRLVERGVPEGKISVVHNAPDPEIFRGRHRPPRRSPVFIHHGTLVWRYGPDLALEAFARALPELPSGARLEIFGEGDASKNLRRQMERLRLRGRVLLHGEVPQEQVARTLARATACVVPNRSDEFTELLLPTKLLEALHLGVPTIASATRVIKESVGEGALLVPAGDVEALARAMIRVASDSQFARELSLRARQAATRFDWNHEKENLLRLYRRLAG